MADHKKDNAELFMAKAESVAGMRSVGDRCINAEKLSWTLTFLMQKCPREEALLQVLGDQLQDYLATSASMVKEILRQRLIIDISKMKRGED